MHIRIDGEKEKRSQIGLVTEASASVENDVKVKSKRSIGPVTETSASVENDVKRED